MNNGGKNHNKPSPKSLYVCMSVCMHPCMHACMYTAQSVAEPISGRLDSIVTLVEVCSAVPWFSMQISKLLAQKYRNYKLLVSTPKDRTIPSCCNDRNLSERL